MKVICINIKDVEHFEQEIRLTLDNIYTVKSESDQFYYILFPGQFGHDRIFGYNKDRFKRVNLKVKIL